MLPPTLLRCLALVVAAAVALLPPLAGLLRRKEQAPDGVDLFDRALGSLRPAFPVQARVGFLLVRDPASSPDELAALYLAQYTLAPSLVRPIVMSECAARGAQACGAGRVEFLVVRTWGAEPDAIARLGGRLGFAHAAESDGFALLARKQP